MIDLKKIAVISFLVVLLTLTQVESLKSFSYIAGDNITLVQNETSLTISADVTQNITTNQSNYFDDIYVNSIHANATQNITMNSSLNWTDPNNAFYIYGAIDNNQWSYLQLSDSIARIRHLSTKSQSEVMVNGGYVHNYVTNRIGTKSAQVDVDVSEFSPFYNYVRLWVHDNNYSNSQSNAYLNMSGFYVDNELKGSYLNVSYNATISQNLTVNGNLKGDTLDNVQTIRFNSNQSWINFTGLNFDEMTTLELTMKTRNAHTSPIYIAFYINDDFNPRNYTSQYFGGDGSSNFAARDESDLFDLIGVDNSTVWNLKIEKAIDRGYYTFGTVARADRGIVSYVHTTYISGTGNITSIKMNTRTGGTMSSTVNGFKTGTVSKLHRID